MFEREVRQAYPISWITESSIILKHLRTLSDTNSEILLADFASGEHDRVPSFFLRLLRGAMNPKPQGRWIVYCIDLHALRLDSLLGSLEEERLLADVRVVQASLDSMSRSAAFRPGMTDFLHENTGLQTSFDRTLMTHGAIPSESFHVGILNNDIVGYLHEYYGKSGDAHRALQGIYDSMKTEGIVVVTMPSMLYRVDNVQLLEAVGFHFIQGVDVETESGHVDTYHHKPDQNQLSRTGHYSFLVLRK